MTIEALAITPNPTEFAPYYGKYTSLVKSDNIVKTLETQAEHPKALFRVLGEQQADFRYAPDKWSVRQMLGHVIDSERIFSYRALRIARGDKTPIEGFEQDGYCQQRTFRAFHLS